MKLSSLILLVTLVLAVIALFLSNVLLRKEYDKVDKSDLYWTYDKILEQPFKHLKIEGGNITNIAFEPSKKSSVRILNVWDGYQRGMIKARVERDTLFINFLNVYRNEGEKRFMQWNTLVRLFSPELLSVNGINTNLGLFKLAQKSIDVNLSGKSKFEVESYQYNLDSLHITQRDSSQVVVEMSPDLMTKDPADLKPAELQSQAVVKSENPLTDGGMAVPAPVRRGWETMNIRAVNADLQNTSLLDVGHAQINSLQYHIADSAAIILSGGTLKRCCK